MIALEFTQEHSSKIPKAKLLQTSQGEEEGKFSLTFEEFLKGATKKSLLKLPNGNFVLPPKEQSKETSFFHDTKDVQELLQLLQNDSESKEQNLSNLVKTEQIQNTPSNDEELQKLLLNPKLTKSLSQSDLKYLIYKAKKYLKEKIVSHPEFQKLQIQELPNTLKSLTKIAQKLQIDLKEITYEKVLSQDNAQKNPFTTQQKAQLQVKKEIQIDTKVKISTTEQKVETTTTQQKHITLTKEQIQTLQNEPLFVATKKVVTTTELIQTKKNIQDHKKSAPQKESTALLSQLLHTSKTDNEPKLSQPQTTHSPMFSSLLQKSDNSDEVSNEESEKKSMLESLLKEQSSPKQHIQTLQNDDFEVKIHEAKQMMRYLSADIKKAIDEYKPPFSRIKVKLNPQKLGEIDITVVQRGKNVHINLSSNNAALNILTNNLTELKTQLQQNGIQNASFAFNAQSQSDSQQRQQQQRRAAFEYTSHEDESEFEQNYLEIIVPRYA